ncbi:hypothetical protein BC936DRAFT_141877, partial [Jimgerdemannia flammicorona]
GFESITGDPEDLTGLRIGIPQEYFVSELDPAIAQLWCDSIAHLRDRGATIVPHRIPHNQLIQLPSPPILQNYFLQAQKVRRLVQQDFDHVFLFPNPVHHHPSTAGTGPGVHVLLSPAANSTAPKIHDCFPSADGTSNAKNPADACVGDVMTVPACLAGFQPLWFHSACRHQTGTPGRRCIQHSILWRIGTPTPNRNLQRRSIHHHLLSPAPITRFILSINHPARPPSADHTLSDRHPTFGTAPWWRSAQPHGGVRIPSSWFPHTLTVVFGTASWWSLSPTASAHPVIGGEEAIAHKFPPALSIRTRSANVPPSPVVFPGRGCRMNPWPRNVSRHDKHVQVTRIEERRLLTAIEQTHLHAQLLYTTPRRTMSRLLSMLRASDDGEPENAYLLLKQLLTVAVSLCRHRNLSRRIYDFYDLRPDKGNVWQPPTIFLTEILNRFEYSVT